MTHRRLYACTYCTRTVHGMRAPKSAYCIVAAAVVKRTRYSEVADATCGCIPISSMRSPLMTPPPTPSIRVRGRVRVRGRGRGRDEG